MVSHEIINLYTGNCLGVVPLSDPLPDDLVDRYLCRLGLARSTASPPSLALLRSIQAAHQDQVAYENIDIHCGRQAPPLDAQASADRIANRKRGGHCFLTNDAFAALLQALGFQVSLHTSAITFQWPARADEWGNHCVPVVHIEGKMYIADVGIGGGPAFPFEVSAGSWHENGFSYGMEYGQSDDGRWDFSHDPVTGAFLGFTVDLASSCEGMVEFSAYHRHLWSHPDSFLKQGVVLRRKRSDGVVLILQSCTLRSFHPSLPRGKVVMKTASSKEEWFALVEEHFLLTLEDLTLAERNAVWEKALADHTAWAAKKTASDAKKPEAARAPLSSNHHSAGGPPPPEAVGSGSELASRSASMPRQLKPVPQGGQAVGAISVVYQY